MLYLAKLESSGFLFEETKITHASHEKNIRPNWIWINTRTEIKQNGDNNNNNNNNNNNDNNSNNNKRKQHNISIYSVIILKTNQLTSPTLDFKSKAFLCTSHC